MDSIKHPRNERDAIAKFVKWFPICVFLAFPPFWEFMYVFLRHITVPNWALACLYGYWTFGVGLALGWFGLGLHLFLRRNMSLVRCVLAISGFLCAMITFLVIDSKLQDRWFDHLDSMTSFGFGACLMWLAFAKEARHEYGIGKPHPSGNGAERK